MNAPQWGGMGRWGSGRRSGPENGRPGRWGAPFPSWDPQRVYRDTGRGWIAGVCAGIADYLGTEPALVRIAAVLCLVFFFLPVIVAYLVCAIVLKPRPPELFATADDEAFWRRLRGDPAHALHGLRERFRASDRRFSRMEALVTSDEFELRRGFRDIGG
ncbi:MAG: envelope stress response membrane protein PspC [Pseudomonadota bacterium]|nr:envelope stress response membrane protein PspC [Pseudomonadota bacterium]